jgi:hypothetical protein
MSGQIIFVIVSVAISREKVTKGASPSMVSRKTDILDK